MTALQHQWDEELARAAQVMADDVDSRTCSTAPTVIIAQDGWQWLVVEVLEDGPGAVLGRWTHRATAEREACEWLDLAGAAT